jgi:hypothetical protein
LANDELTEKDPQHPKVLFPTPKQCPKCYLSLAKNINDLAEHESPWNINEVLLFLTSFYSKYQIEGVDELDGKNVAVAANAEKQQVQPPSVIDQPDHKPPPPSPPPKQMEQLAPPKQMEQLAPQKPNDEKKRDNHHIERFDIDQPDGGTAPAHKSSDYKLMFIFFVLALASFAGMYVYFNYVKRKGKLKKHII